MEWESRLLGWKKLGGKANYIANEAQFIRKRVLPMCMDWRDIWAGDQEEGGCVRVYDLRVGEDECAKSGVATYLGSGRGEAAWERLG